MNAIRLTITLNQPLLMTGVSNAEENSSTSLSHILGSALRGVAIGNYIKQHPNTNLAHDPDARALFFNDKVRFLNGYPAYPSDITARALPAPHSWHMDKHAADDPHREVRDYIWMDQILPFERSKRERRPFYWQRREKIRPMIKPARWSNVHNASKNPMIKQEGTSNVFRYDALAQGQLFISYVCASSDDLLAKVKHYLPKGHCFLGGSQSAGYGQVSVEQAEITNWQGECASDYEISDYTIMTLLSDAILQTAAGQATTTFHTVLQETLDRPDLPRPRQSYLGTTLVGGFNRKWGLPLPQHWAVGMGSTFVYGADDLDIEELDHLVRDGIGLRRGEGFGRIGVNLNAESSFKTTVPKSKQSNPKTLSSTSLKLARNMAKRRLMRKAKHAILAHVDVVSFRKPLPQNTQLSRLRPLLRQARQNNDLNIIVTYLDDLKDAAGDQFAYRWIQNLVGGDVRWGQWLRDRCKLADGLQEIEIDIADQTFQVAGESPAGDQKLRVEVTCLLIEAMIRKAMREEA